MNKRQTTALQAKERAIDQVMSRSVSLRAAARQSGIPLSTLHFSVQSRKRANQLPRGRLTALSHQQEQIIVGTLNHYANQGIPLDKSHLLDAAKLLIRHIPVFQRAKLPFKGNRPTDKWARSFIKRHKSTLIFAKPTRQEAIRFAACSAEVLTTHYATLEKLVRDNHLDAHRIWNLDETGITPGRDVNGRCTRKRFMSRLSTRDARVDHFKYTHRITMMPIVSAAGEHGPPLFVFKGNKIPVRTVVRDGMCAVESPVQLLPRHSVIAMRSENGGVDKYNFCNWAKHFVESVRDLTMNGRKVLLIYDAYRSHLSLEVLELFESNNVIVYALPAHTSGKTQLLDVVVFGSFKRALNTVMNDVTVQSAKDLDDYNLCSLMKEAYARSFTASNIQGGFRRAGIWPFDPSKLLDVPRPGPALEFVSKPTELIKLFDEKRRSSREQVLGTEVSLLSSGYINTTCGAVMTAPRVMGFIRERRAAQSAARESARAQALLKEVEMARKKAVESEQRKRMDDFV